MTRFRTRLASVSAVTFGMLALACSGSDAGQASNPGNVGGSQTSAGTGGAGAGSPSSGGTLATGGANSTGGSLPATGGSLASTGGAPPTGGTTATGGANAGTGGVPVATGGAVATGGTKAATGGEATTGGAAATGGTKAATGGSVATGGNTSAGGSKATGGTKAGVGGTSFAGGAKATGGVTSVAGTTSAGGAGNPSTGCGKTPTLKNSPTATANQNTLTISGTSRQFLIRWPTNYDNTHPYRLILDFHGAGGKDTDLAPSYFGLFDLSNNSTIFIAPSANGGTWDATTDLTFVDEILKAVEADLCIDTSRVEIEGFSQGGAMVAVLACQRPGVFRAAVGHSRGGLTAPTTCQPIPYLGSLGLSDISGNSQATQTDPFAKWNGCTVTTMPLAPTGGHLCTNYTGCPAADPVIWCSYDGGHTASPTDAGKSTSWMPQEVWSFLSVY